jgi:NAD-dependent dihydropyrimidine dehydrogenase PreA subunit
MCRRAGGTRGADGPGPGSVRLASLRRPDPAVFTQASESAARARGASTCRRPPPAAGCAVSGDGGVAGCAALVSGPDAPHRPCARPRRLLAGTQPASAPAASAVKRPGRWASFGPLRAGSCAHRLNDGEQFDPPWPVRHRTTGYSAWAACKPTLALNTPGRPDGLAARKILRSCVHCGFCTATCPTYQLLGDELNGPARPRLPDRSRCSKVRSPPAKPSFTWTAA